LLFEQHLAPIGSGGAAKLDDDLGISGEDDAFGSGLRVGQNVFDLD
jgi:hypothetical protein